VVDAIRKESLNPVAAAKDLKAIINLFSSDEEATDREKQCIRLAKRNFDRLKARIDRNADTYVNVLLERIEYARGLMDSEPEQGRQILRDLCHLYTDKPWAKEVVESAQRLIEQSTDLTAVTEKPKVSEATESSTTAENDGPQTAEAIDSQPDSSKAGG
jgi:hypothetical protein